MENPLISIIVPCYNQAQYLDECLQSVLDQTYPNWECIIVNDGSPDNTEDVVKKWLANDSRYKYFYKENGGVSAARNFGIERAKGEWILPLDGDDYIGNNYLELGSNHFAEDDLKVIYCNAKKFGAITKKWELQEFSLQQLATDNMIFCCAFFRKKDWLRVGGYDENLKIGYEDWEFWISILKNTGNVLKIDQECFFYRIKVTSRNVTVKEHASQVIKYVEKKHLDFFHEQLGSLKLVHDELLEANKIIAVINGRFFSRLSNKIYSVLENLLQTFHKK